MVDVSKLEELKDELGTVVGYVDGDKVIDEDGEQIGHIDAESGDAVFDEVEEIATVEAEADIDAVETEYTGDEDPIKILDEYVDALHRRGMPVLDVPAYPTEEMIAAADETTAESLQMLKDLMDFFIDVIDPTDIDTITNFGNDTERELLQVAADIEADDTSALDDFGSIDQQLKSLMNNQGDIFGKLSSMASDGADWAKKNPGKAAAGGAVAGIGALVSLPVAAAAGASAWVGSKIWKRKQEQQEDPLRLEAEALTKELESMRGDGEKAFNKLEVASQHMDERNTFAKRTIAARIKQARRICIFIGVAQEVRRQLNDEIIPQIQAALHEDGAQTDTLNNHLEVLTTASEALDDVLRDLETGRALGRQDIYAQRATQAALAKIDRKIKSHLSKTKAEWVSRNASAREMLRTMKILQAVDGMDQLSDNMVEASSDMAEVQAQITQRSSARGAVDQELVAKSLESTAKVTKMLSTSNRAEGERKRLLLRKATEDLEKTGEESRKNRLLPPAQRKAAQKAAKEQDNGPAKLPKPGQKRVIRRAPK